MISAKTEDDYLITIPAILKHYQIIKIIGAGSTCVVGLVEDMNSSQRFAAKIMSKSDLKNKNLTKLAQKEIDVLTQIDHENIVKLYEAFMVKCENDKLFVIIMDYCENGDLFSYIQNHDDLNEIDKYKILLGVLDALECLHNKGISHGDLKIQNILLDQNLNPKLCDFGFSNLSNIAGDECKNGTIYYAAPEIFESGEFNTLLADVWSFGILLYALIEGEFPFKGGHTDFIIEQIISATFSMDNCHDQLLKNLVENCTTINPESRLTIREIKNDPFFNRNASDMKQNKNQADWPFSYSSSDDSLLFSGI